jgi:hypothetical protein
LLSIKTKDKNSSSSSSSSSFSFSTVLDSYSGRDFSNVNKQFKDELNLNVPINHPFVDLIGANFNRNDYSSNRCLFNYNGIMHCYVYNFLDLLISFKNKE